ncbi:MAG: cytidylate kinase [Deltaproteobacteria bacterium HGW-Deltaproteobacteria-11]|nr:MAG: cytidylate kinase [Deltaproteobacteria bacterium HGW-Deltaproteobacteria-11]
MKKGLLITIDGPAGSGKSTVSRLLAKKLSYLYLDTGALYRAVACQAIRNGVSATDEEGVAELCRRTEIRLRRVDDCLKVFVDAQDVTEKIRTEPVGLLASTLSAMPVVRSSLLTIQRESGKNGGIIAEGRDMGTVVFPDADLKFFLDADVEERARRRYMELVVRGEKVDYPSLKKDLLCRDRQDRERAVAPLKVPEGAIMVDSTRLSIDAVVKAMLAAIPEQR